VTTPLRAPPARILHARYRASRASLLARPDGPVEAVDLATGVALTLRRSEQGWHPCERPREPELIGSRVQPALPEPHQRWIAPRTQIAALAGSLALGIGIAAFARGAIDHGGSAARAIERRATPSAEAYPRLRTMHASVPIGRARGGPARAVERPRPPAHAHPPAVVRTAIAVAPSLRRAPARTRPAPPPDLPPPAAAIDAMPLPD